jgi:hypothetical protein
MKISPSRLLRQDGMGKLETMERSPTRFTVWENCCVSWATLEGSNFRPWQRTDREGASRRGSLFLRWSRQLHHGFGLVERLSLMLP